MVTMRIDIYLWSLGDALRKIAANAAPREACGVITRQCGLIEARNRSGTPTETFNAGPLHALALGEGEPVAIWHTHPNNEPPSPQDVAGCAASFCPWIIAGPARLFVIYPETPPLIGREFEYGGTDCWTLISDWFAETAGIFLPWFDRPADGWWHTAGPSPYVENAEAYGFSAIPFSECGLDSLRVGDVILMKVAARRVNHAAVYVGGGQILHHLYGELSRVELLDGRWQACATHVCRNRDLATRC